MVQLVTSPAKTGVSGLRRRLQRLMLVLAAVAGMANAAQAQDIEINDTNFPNENFRTHVKQYDTDSDGSLSDKEIAAVTSIDVSTQTITDLKGIEHFTALTELSCYNNQLTELDVSKNTALTDLWCDNNQLTALDLSANTALTKLWCANNQLTALDVSTNTALTQLSCYRNQLSTFDVSNNTALTELSCDHNQLTTLDLSANTALTRLSCVGNQLTALDLSANTALIFLACQFNQLSTLNVSNCTVLRFLYCLDNQLSTLDVSKNTALWDLSCDHNQLTALDVSNCTALTQLECYDNQLTALNVSANTALTDLYCNNNQLPTLDVSNCTALKQLYCDNNLLTTLDVSANTALTRLDCYNNQLTVLDVSTKNTALTTLICCYNQLTALNVSANTALTELYCFGNQIQADEMLALVNSLPTVTSGGFYVVDTQNGSEGNVITKAQVAIAQSKGWTVYDLDFKGGTAVEYAGVEEYVLTLGVPTNGTLTATPNGSVGEGTAVIITATPDEGYKLKTLKAYKTGDESQTVAISENKFTMPAHDVTVEAEFEAITYTLTYAAGAGGTIQGSATQTVAHGQSGTEVEAKPNEGYKFVKWSDGRTTAKRTDYNVQGNLTVTAEFEKSNTTGLLDTKFDALSVYPNPTTGQLWVSVPEHAEGTAAEVLVYNAAGQLLQRVAARAASTGSAASRLSIDLSAYPAGVYLISVGNAVAKVVKQ